jgi:protein arginine kinase activator
MKKCRRCTKPATLHITEIHEGQVQALHLCESCAQEYLNTVEVGSVPDELEPAAAEETGLVPTEQPDATDDLVCPQCGISFKQFRGQGRLGCSHDYVVFRDELLPLLESIHGETQHVGKIPRRAPDASRRQYDLLRLRNELRAAVENESYEEAARLRDRIQALEQNAGAETTDR